MKRFLIALFICLVPFGVRAEFGLWDMTKSYILAFCGNVSPAGDPLKPDEFFGSMVKLDDFLRDYVDAEDYDYVLKHGGHFYFKEDPNYTAQQSSGDNCIYVDPKDFNNISSVARFQAVVHHEVQHLKDDIMFENVTKVDAALMSFSPYSDRMTEQLWHAVLEARAYSEERYFLYTKMKELEKSLIKKYGSIDNIPPEGYNEFLKYNDFMGAYYKEVYPKFPSTETISYMGYSFNEAIKAGKSAEEARRMTAIAALNWQFVDSAYMREFATTLVTFGNHVDVDKIIDILNKDGENRFTLADLYAAERFWIHLCSYDDTKDTEECKKAKIRYQEKHCSCNKNDRRVEAEAACSTAKGWRKRIVTVSEQQEKDYEKCCYSDWDFSSDYIPKGLNIFEWTREMLGKN